MRLADGADLAEWRGHARALLAEGVAPEQVQWQVGEQAGLLPANADGPMPSMAAGVAGSVPREFLVLATRVLAHADARRHAVLYRLLWRLAHGERALLRIVTDDDVAWALRAAKAVSREKHKMKAFVRFREVQGAQGNVFVAWFEPEHDVLPQVAPFFVRRFAGMRWSILTPTRSAHWDGQALTLGAGARRTDAPGADALEDLWRTYFANIFNPARLKVDAMVKEMPVRYWKNLPEATLIPGLIRDASARMESMVQAPPTVPRKAFPAPAARAVPAATGGLDVLRVEAAACRACPLWQPATQTVFGEGPADARVVLLGEQPGDQEDLAGRPFVGPSGQLLDRALKELGLDRRAMYVTNTVKHFKFEPRGKRRLHARANATEQAACRRWLEAELIRLRPRWIVCLGAMAAQAILGKDVRLLEERGRWHALGDGTQALATVHPSYLLRLTAGEREVAWPAFVRDLALLQRALAA
ncbi:UdgX family uracil-DNA binding protein [Frateuria sp. MAH-13]|uniref:Type-4 uracil-DNA glycosylase n=1 Tax=Frateuria flava TaxID=2821489 RepID=A0ABS4DN92_9GAMM|nr:UdgX family uracil-DNA binding protein [Frateuria flava]